MASKLLAGFALGVLAGVLLAPDRGSDTRKKIAQKGNDLKNKFNDFVDTLHEKFDSVKEDAKDMATEAKHKAPSFGNEATWNG